MVGICKFTGISLCIIISANEHSFPEKSCFLTFPVSGRQWRVFWIHFIYYWQLRSLMNKISTGSILLLSYNVTWFKLFSPCIDRKKYKIQHRSVYSKLFRVKTHEHPMLIWVAFEIQYQKVSWTLPTPVRRLCYSLLSMLIHQQNSFENLILN